MTDLPLKAKRLLKLTGKIIGGIILLIFLYGIVLANFHAKDGGRYECSGTLTSNGVSQEAQMFVRIELYRRWLMPWADRDGNAKIELPGHWSRAMSLEDASSLDLWFLHDGVRRFEGRISRLSNTISVATPQGVFDGSMKRLDP